MSTFARGAGVVLLSAVIATACGSSSSKSAVPGTTASGSSTAPGPATANPAGPALPTNGCTLLTSAEVEAFLGSTPPCTSRPTGAGDPQVASATWQATRTGASLEVGLTRTANPPGRGPFEEDAGTKSNSGAKVVAGIGDDAVLIRQPHSDTSGAIWILAGNDEYQVVVTRGTASGKTLANALTTVGRRLLETYR